MSSAKSRMTRRSFLKAAGMAAAGTVVAACGAETAPTQAPAAAAAATEAPESMCEMDWDPTLPPFEKYDPDVVLMVEDTGQTFKEGDTYDNNPMYNLRRDLMGIRFEPHWTAAGDARAAKRAADIAGGTMADYFVCNTVEAAEFIANGAAEDIRDVVDATYSPLSKQVMHYPDGESWVPATRGDKLYGFPEEGSPSGWQQPLLDPSGLAGQGGVAAAHHSGRVGRNDARLHGTPGSASSVSAPTKC